jgi:hypothetical protein
MTRYGMTAAQMDKILINLPTSLAGVSLNKIKVKQGINYPAVPRMLLSMLVSGNRVRYWHNLLRVTCDAEKETEDRQIGQIQRATFQVLLQSYDPDQLANMMADLQVEIWGRQLKLDWKTDRMKLAEVFNPQEMPDIYDDKAKKLLHGSALDFYVEYELSWPDLTPDIQSFNYQVEIDDIQAFNASYGVPR